MHIRHTSILICLTLACASCDKARELAEKAAASAKEKIAGDSSGAVADPELLKLVDETAEGVVFRKDLPFPSQLEVRVTRRQEWSGRLIQQNEIDRSSQTIKGTRSMSHLLVLTGDELRLTPEQSTFTIPSPDDPKAAAKTLADPLKALTSQPKPITMLKHGNSWQAQAGGDFHAVALARELSPVMQDLLVENSLAPRPLWFTAKKRFKPGDTLTVTGDSLPMLLAGKASGNLQLTFESRDAVEGHPCAVFSIKGDFSRKQFPDLDGQFNDEEVTIQSGKLWLSLIHPLILREELDSIQSIKSGPAGMPTTHGQGAVKVSVTRSWKTP